MTGQAFSDRPSAFLLPETMRRMLGLQGQAVLLRLLEVGSIREAIDAILLERLGPVPAFDADAEDVQRFLCARDAEGVRRLARVVAVLSQAPAARIMLHGPTLAAYNEMCPGGQILPYMRRTELPACSALPPLRVASTEALELCTQVAERLLYGLLPEGLLLRIAGQRTPDNYPMPLALPDAAARESLVALARAALGYLNQYGAEDAPSAAA